MNKTIIGMLFVSLIAIAGFSMVSATQQGVILTTDKTSYSFGDGITVTATNNGNTGVDYFTCFSNIFFQLTDPNGKTLVTENPMIKAACMQKTLLPGQSVSGSWNQMVFDANGANYGQAHAVTTPGTYTATFANASVQFTIEGTANPSGLVVFTDKQTYSQGENVVISATNNGNTPIGYSPCKPEISIISNGQEVSIWPPDGEYCMLYATIRPGETVKLYEWGQKYYPKCTTLGNCPSFQVPEGVYTVKFNGASASFNIVIPPLPLPNPQKTFTLNLKEGWNLVSEPVYYREAVGEINSATPLPPGQDEIDSGKPTILSNTCGQATLWSYNGNEYTQTNLENGNLQDSNPRDLTMKIGDSVMAPNGYSIKLADMQLPASPNAATTAVFSITDNNGNEVKRFTLEGPVTEFATEGFIIHLYEAVLGSYIPTGGYASYARVRISFDNSINNIAESNWDARRAYWIHADSACQITLGGDSEITANGYQESLNAGWHMIPAPSQEMAFSILQGSCAGSVKSGPWAWDASDGKYLKASTLVPGMGYWIKTNAACELRNAFGPPNPPA